MFFCEDVLDSSQQVVLNDGCLKCHCQQSFKIIVYESLLEMSFKMILSNNLSIKSLKNIFNCVS